MGDYPSIACDSIEASKDLAHISSLQILFQNARIPCHVFPHVPKDRYARKWCTPLKKNWMEIHKPVFGWEVMNAFWGGGIDKEGTYLYLPIVDCVYRGNDRLNYRYNIYKVKLWVDSNAEDGIYFFKIISKDYWWW